MTYLVDANVLSEATKPAPNSNAIEWLRHNERTLNSQTISSRFVFAKATSKTSVHQRLLQEETCAQERRRDVFDIFRGHAAGVEMVSPSPEGRYNLLDFCPSCLGAEPEALALGE